MRIETQRGAQLVQAEIALLKGQIARCSSQVGKLSSFALEQAAGAGAEAMTLHIRMQASVVKAHMLFFQSLLVADQRNLALLRSLPTTSAGVLDTDVAQRRIEEARRRCQELEWRRDEALRIQRTRELAPWAMDCPVAPSVLDAPYDLLILRQRDIIAQNERVLERARGYEREVRGIYGAVDTSLLRGAERSVGSFCRGAGWGDVSWMQTASFLRDVQAHGVLSAPPAADDMIARFLAGELSVEGALWAVGAEASVGMLSGSVAADVLGFDAGVAPHGKGKRSVDEDDGKAMAGVESTVGVHAARGEAKLSLGWLSAKHETSLAAGSVEAVLGMSLMNKSVPNPALAAKGEAKAAVLESQTTGTFGTSDFNYHAKAKGEALTAEAEAGLTAGAEGVEAKVGAEAYLATGEISGGFTILGVTVETALSAKVAGGGAKVGVGLGGECAEGEIGLGLGVGLGAKVKVDWSKAAGAVERTLGNLDAWWNNLNK